MTARLALIAGQGDLPAALYGALDAPPMVCAVMGHEPNSLTPDWIFRLETLGSLINDLAAGEVSEVCLCGSIRRPQIDPAAIDAATFPLIPALQAALAAGDDGALRAVMALFEERGLKIRAAHEIAPSLLAPLGILGAMPSDPSLDADLAAARLALQDMGSGDIGQAVVARDGKVIAREDARGTDAMLADLSQPDSDTGDPRGKGGVLIKAPKPGQDLRADLPTIGPDTATGAQGAGLRGIAVAAGATLVLDRASLAHACDKRGLFLCGVDACMFS